MTLLGELYGLSPIFGFSADLPASLCLDGGTTSFRTRGLSSTMRIRGGIEQPCQRTGIPGKTTLPLNQHAASGKIPPMRCC